MVVVVLYPTGSAPYLLSTIYYLIFVFAFLLALCAPLLSALRAGPHVCRDTGTQILTGNKVNHKHVLSFIISMSVELISTLLEGNSMVIW